MGLKLDSNNCGLQWSHVFSDMEIIGANGPFGLYVIGWALQWSHVFSDMEMVDIIGGLAVTFVFVLQWSHVFSDMEIRPV